MEGRAETGIMSTHANVPTGTQGIHVLVSKNGGACRDGVNEYSCQCAVGYTGDTCIGK